MSSQVDPESIANLSSNDETSISLTLTGKSANRGRGRLVVEGECLESVEFQIELIDKVGFLSEALSITERLLDDVENRSGGRGGRSSDIPNRLSEIERRLSRIVDRVRQDNGKGNSKSVDNKIESIINQFDALIQKLTKSNGTDLSERARAEYVQLCKDAVNSLEQAIKAEL